MATGGSGGSADGGSSSGAGGAETGGAAPGSGGARPSANYTLEVDTPLDGSTVSGSVLVSGWATGFKNVEVWDGTHTSPPLAQGTPDGSGAFSLTVDVSQLPPGPASWTVWAWDTPPGATPTQSASVPLSLTIGTGQSGSGGAAGTGGTTGAGGTTGSETIGTGDVNAPASGPSPTDASKIGGASFVLVKNWDFGTSGDISDIATLSSEFQYHDMWGTIANGTNYGAVTVAPNPATAISGQPVEDASRPYREFTSDALRTYVRPLSASQSTVTVSSHDAGNGSMTAKWHLPTGGANLGKDLLWETRVRMPQTVAAYWFAIWTAGTTWNKGAEMDVLESFGTPNIYPPPAAFHVNSVGGQDDIDYWSGWPKGLDTAGIPQNDRDLREWHVFTWLYRKDDTFVVYYDGYVAQTGTIHWTNGGAASAGVVDLWFLFDFGWGHTQIQDVNISLPTSGFGITYETDYSRVYMR
jgi:hypothetical protein